MVRVDDLAGELADVIVSAKDIQRVLDAPRGRHAFLIMLKPELLSASGKITQTRIIESVLRILAGHGVRFHRVRVVASDSLLLGRVVRRLYPRLWLSSQLSPQKARSVFQPFETRFDTSVTVLSARSFLRTFTDYSAGALLRLVDAVGSTKLGNGLYAAQVEVRGSKMVVLNAFAPGLMERYELPGAACVFFECSSDSSWHDIRDQHVGSINPARAERLSLRHRLFELQDELLIGPISLDRNAVHVSPGPIEARSQLSVAFADPSYFFKLGLPRCTLNQMLRIFEATEDLDLAEALELVRTSGSNL